MKIILATPLLPPEIGGPATYTVELAKRLRDIHEVTVVAYSTQPPELDGLKLVVVSKKQFMLLRLFKFVLALWGVAKDADVIYVQNAMAAGLPAMIIGKLLRKPVIVKFVGDEAWERARQSGCTEKNWEEFLRSSDGGFKISLMRTIQGFVLRGVSLIATPSAYLKDVLVDAYGVLSERVIVNYNAAAQLQLGAVLPSRVPYQVSTASRLVAWKHIDGVIRAIVEVHKKFPESRLVIVGDGPEKKKLQELVEELRAEMYIRFAGILPQADTLRLQASSAVHVLNSSYEGLPIEAINTFGVGTPLIATNIHGTNEVVYHEETGLLIEPKNDAQLAAAIGRLFDDPALCIQVVEGGKKLLQSKFSWEEHLSILQSNFERLVQIT